MVSKIRAHIANTKSTFTGLQILRMLIWWLVKNINLSRKCNINVYKPRNKTQMLNIDKKKTKNHEFLKLVLSSI